MKPKMDFETKRFIYHAIGVLVIIVLIVWYLIAVVAPWNYAEPKIMATLTPANTMNPDTNKWIKYPQMTEEGNKITVLFATYRDKFCLNVNKDAAIKHSKYKLAVDGKESDKTQICWNGKEARARKTISACRGPWDYECHELQKDKPTMYEEFSVFAENRAGSVSKTIAFGFLADCDSLGTIVDGNNGWTQCDELSSYTTPQHSSSKPSTSSSSSKPSTSISTPTSVTKPTQTSSGLRQETAERLCISRAEKSYSDVSAISSNIIGASWEIELEGYHYDVPANTMMDIICVVSGGDSNPSITKFNAEEYEDFYYDEYGHTEECYFGYDYATGECR